jgi:hypothetical protein
VRALPPSGFRDRACEKQDARQPRNRLKSLAKHARGAGALVADPALGELFGSRGAWPMKQKTRPRVAHGKTDQDRIPTVPSPRKSGRAARDDAPALPRMRVSKALSKLARVVARAEGETSRAVVKSRRK